MCLNQGRPGMPSGLSQLRSTCMAPWLMVAASLGSIVPEASFALMESFRRLPADSKSSIALLTAVRSRAAEPGELDKGSWWELPDGPQVAHADAGSFDCVAVSLRESATPLRMTGLFLASSFTNWRMLLA